MFSYCHVFHAGNHADVLKHAILVAILRHLAQKDKAFWVFDTHAGAGLYRLDAAQARKNAEYASGIEALWPVKKLPPLLKDYCEAVACFDAAHGQQPGAAGRGEREAGAGRPGRTGGHTEAGPDRPSRAGRDREATQGRPGRSGGHGEAGPEGREPAGAASMAGTPPGKVVRTGRLPRWYPGSPWLALQAMRPQDRLRCFEAHPSEIRALQNNLAAAGRRQVQVFGEDGFAGLKALLPPVSRRGLVIIDPSYEDKRDYSKARRTLIEALERFATGTMMLWYPLVRRRELMLLLENLPKLPGLTDWLDVRLQVSAPPEDGYGLYGSGVFVINPPYTLASSLKEAMPVLWELLGQDARSGWWMGSSNDR